jgi:hypothetical protein
MAEPIQTDTADVLAVDASVLRSTESPGYGVTTEGFVAKPFARILAEKLALARELLGADVDLTAGSAVRKLLEISALEDARTWAALAGSYDDCFVISARGEALGRLGEELGLPRPHLEARGTVRVALSGTLPTGVAKLQFLRGARLLTPGGHHVATDETFVLSPASPTRDVPVVAFYPGPEHNLDPSQPDQRIDRWDLLDPKLAGLRAAEQAAGGPLTTIAHPLPLTGGELRWPDDRYRELLLRAPRSIWTVDAIQIAVWLVPGVRRVQVRDPWGGLDLHQSIFGNFNFIERVFGSERDLASPYYFTVLVAPTPGAIWDGPDGLRVQVESALEDLRPIGIFPRIEPATEIGIGVAADLIVRDVPLPSGPPDLVNASEAAIALKDRISRRLRRSIEALGFGEPVRSAEVTWAIMSEPGIADAQNVRLLRYPPGFASLDLGQPVPPGAVETLDCGVNARLQANQIPVYVDDLRPLRITGRAG